MTKVVRSGKQPNVITGQPIISGSVEARYTDAPSILVELRCVGDFHVRAELSFNEAERLIKQLQLAVTRFYVERDASLLYAIPLDTSALGIPKHVMHVEERDKKTQKTLCGIAKPQTRWYVVAINNHFAPQGVCEACYQKAIAASKTA